MGTEANEKPSKRVGKIDYKVVAQRLCEGKMKKKDIAVEAGSMAKADSNKCLAVNLAVTRKGFKEVARPIIERFESLRDKMITRLEEKAMTGERMKDLVDGVDKLTRNIQLLGGKPTDRLEVGAEKAKEINDALDGLL